MPSSKTGLGLAQIRARKGVALAHVAEKTKISMFFLRAIEDEQFSKLPGGVFDRNYLRQYAEAVGINEAKLLERYALWQAENAPEPAPPKRSAARSWFASLLASVLN
jgi:cytoskeletal protein RodZ